MSLAPEEEDPCFWQIQGDSYVSYSSFDFYTPVKDDLIMVEVISFPNNSS